MSSKNFSDIQKIAYQVTGINLAAHKQNMIYGRLARRLRHLNLKNFDEYCKIISDESHAEQMQFVNAITTNLTSFFREVHHFNLLRDTVIPALITARQQSKKLRIWSAGCSTGEEPYSIAMVLAGFPELRNWNAKILATDLDTNVVKKARSGQYGIERAESIPPHYAQYLDYDESQALVRVKDSVRKFITFNSLNLLHEWPMKGSFDLIFCRNVVIYFDTQTQKTLFDRYANILQQDGHLFIGHSENLHNVSTRFKSLGKTVYQKLN